MATVRISKALLNDISNKISSMRQRDLKDGNVPAPELALAQAAEAAVYKDAPQLRGNLPSDWVGPCAQADLHFHGGHGESRVSFANPITLPRHLANTYDPDIQIPETIWRAYPAVIEWLEARKVAREQRTETFNKWAKINEEIMRFLNSCKSLNDAAKQWPGILLYVPDVTKGELERKVERTKRVKEDEDDVVEKDERAIDFDTLAVAAIQHKMGGV